MTLSLAIPIAIAMGGICFAAGFMIGLVAGWRSRKSDIARDAATFRAELARAERRAEATLRDRYGEVPRVVGQ